MELSKFSWAFGCGQGASISPQLVLKGYSDVLEAQRFSLPVSEVVKSSLPSGISKMSLCRMEKEKEDEGSSEPNTREGPRALLSPQRCRQAMSFPWGPNKSVPKFPSLLVGHIARMTLSCLCLSGKLFYKDTASQISSLWISLPESLQFSLPPSPAPVPVPIPYQWSHISKHLVMA